MTLEVGDRAWDLKTGSSCKVLGVRGSEACVLFGEEEDELGLVLWVSLQRLKKEKELDL